MSLLCAMRGGDKSRTWLQIHKVLFMLIFLLKMSAPSVVLTLADAAWLLVCFVTGQAASTRMMNPLFPWLSEALVVCDDSKTISIRFLTRADN